MFTEKCFIRKNTKELQDKLSDIGYNILSSARLQFINNILCGNGFCASILTNKSNKSDFVDCGKNEELFLAIAALRDDSNEHQWFIWDDDEDEGDKWKLYDGNSNWSWWIFEVHKATIEELIEHFK